MYVAEILFRRRGKPATGNELDAIQGALGLLRQSGQILGREFPILTRRGGYSARVLVPDRDALRPRHHSSFVRGQLARLSESGIAPVRMNIVGKDAAGGPADRCRAPGWHILFTTYLAIAPPLRCGRCFRPVPLYRIRDPRERLAYELLCWESDYQACDTLQMNCRTGERFGTRELSDPGSSLGRRGRLICRRIRRLTGVPTYYYLLRASGAKKGTEENRPCPGCGGRWRLRERLHGLFDFKCDRCRMVSNLAWNLH